METRIAAPYLLTASDRTFFQTVRAAVLANPFRDRRRRIDLEISGLLNLTRPDEVIAAAVQAVSARIRRLESRNRVNLRDYGDEDRKFLKGAILYDMFHRYIPGFDRLILAQQKSLEKSLPVKFAGAAIDDLESKGFEPQQAERYFALSYQLRRAFFFIRLGLVGRSASMQTFRESLRNNVFISDIDLYGAYLWNRMEDFSTTASFRAAGGLLPLSVYGVRDLRRSGASNRAGPAHRQEIHRGLGPASRGLERRQRRLSPDPGRAGVFNR